jgi:uncharacterized membrane protein YqiK
MENKAQGLSLNVVIIAAIALVVLVVLVTIFTGQIGGWVQQTEECSSKGGDCFDSASECRESGDYAAVVPGGCPGEQVCCKQIVRSS